MENYFALPLSLWQPNCASLGNRKIIYSVLLFRCSACWICQCHRIFLQRLYWKAHLIMFPCLLHLSFIRFKRIVWWIDTTKLTRFQTILYHLFLSIQFIARGKTYPTMPCYLSHEMDIRNSPDIKVHGANMGPIWGWQDPGGPHVGPTNFAMWGTLRARKIYHHFADDISKCIWFNEYFWFSRSRLNLCFRV